MKQLEKITDFYRFDKILGEGSFGQVKKVIKKSNGEQFAVKVINKADLSTDDLSQLQLEIDHPNVVKLIEIYDDQDYFYMILELMTGGELFERIVEKDHYSEQEAAETLLPLVDAIRYCHQLGIAHRDLKPENMLYQNTEGSSLLKISDFGLSRFVNDDLMTTQCGTPGYVAPEIIAGKGYDVMIDWLCGFPPFYDENNDKLFQTISEGQYEFPSPYWDDISSSAKDLISKLLCVDPRKRLSGDQIIKHPWLSNKSSKHLIDVPKKIGELSTAGKKLKKSMTAVRGIVRIQMMKNALGKSKKV